MLNYRYFLFALVLNAGPWQPCLALEPLTAETISAELKQVSQVPKDDRNSESFCNRIAAINRLLVQLSSDERYQILKAFTLTEGADDIESVSAVCNVAAPPKEFARLIGARPRNNVFANPSVANVDGVFSTVWLLVESAEDLGLLRVLSNEVESLSGTRSNVLRAILFASQTGKQEKVRSIIERLANENALSSQQAVDAAVLSCACREMNNCRDAFDQIRHAVENQQSISPAVKAILSRTQFSTREHDQIDPFRMNKNWIAVGKHASLFTHDNHITHLAGGDAYYVFRYPLSGDFRFQVQQVAQQEDDACLLQFANRSFGLKPFYRPAANLRELEKSGDTVRARLNGYRLGDSPMDATSPWIVLRPNAGVDDRLRFMKLTGSPTIPREVSLISNNSSAAWTSSDSSTQILSSNGVLEADQSGTLRQRIIRHDRPLQSGETFQYEYYASDQHVAHPAIGQFAFLLKPDGVKLHWATRSDDDWTGLSADNELVEPLNRRGPRKLPIRSNDWNQVSMSLKDNQLSVQLNDTLVYSRSLRPNDDARFGWFHNPSETSIRVRNAVLRGDWPESFDADAISEPRGEVEPSDLARSLFREQDICDGVLAVSEEASRLQLQERYDYLSKWVLPNDWHQTLRLQSDFGPLHSPRPQVDAAGKVSGNLISPALKLIDVAAQLQRLGDIEKAVSLYKPTDLHQQRNRSALLALIHHRMGSQDETLKHAEALFRLTGRANEGIEPIHLWPDYLLSQALANVPAYRDIVRDLLSLHQLPRLNPESAIESELNRFWNSYRNDGLQELADKPRTQLNQWLTTSRYHSKWRSQGHSAGEFHSVSGGISYIASHSHDLLFFKSPLLGDYEFQFDQRNIDSGDVGVVAGDVGVVAGGTRIKVEEGKSFTIGGDESAKVRTLIERPVAIERAWVRHRYAVRNGVMSVHINGRKILARDVDDGYPWLGFSADHENAGPVRNVTILGSPTIPSTLNLIHPDLLGWRSYYSPGVENKNGPWSYQDGRIVGQKEDFPKGAGRERFLYYQRPLGGSDAVEYEFFYEPGSAVVHPALDRTAFVFGSDGIQLHCITDGPDDRTFDDKNNTRLVPAEQRARPSDLLKVKQWNKARIAVDGDSLQIQLNGTVVYQHQLSPVNQRLFGLFYFSDQSSASVRNIVLHGSWPTELPHEREQQLASSQLAEINASRDTLASSMLYEFAQTGIPEKLFSVQGGKLGTYTQKPNGLELTIPGAAGQRQSGMLSQFRLSGDFDISAEFEDFRPDLGEKANAQCSVRLDVVLDGKDLPRGTVLNYRVPGGQKVNGTLAVRRAGAGDARVGQPIDWESRSSTLRIARRGDKMHMLIKDDDALGFRLFRTHQVPTTECKQIRLIAVAANAAATSVVWKRLEIQAEDISRGGQTTAPATASQKSLFVVNADGTGMRQITIGPEAQGFNTSPHFSPDAKQIIFHSGTGRPSLSHVFVINSDGTGLKDLGPGSLARWMPDGKRIAFCAPEFNLATMNPDGSDRQIIGRDGWAIQVSPDGKEVFFKDFALPGLDFTIMNLKTKTRRKLLTGIAQQYGGLYWNQAWSPDGKWISFYGRNRKTGKHEFAVVSTKGFQDGFRVLKKDVDEFFPRTSWHPDGDRILIGHRPKNQQSGPYVLKLSDPDYCEPLFKLSGIRSAEPPSWSRDGSKIVFMGVAK